MRKHRSILALCIVALTYINYTLVNGECLFATLPANNGQQVVAISVIELTNSKFARAIDSPTYFTISMRYSTLGQKLN